MSQCEFSFSLTLAISAISIESIIACAEETSRDIFTGSIYVAIPMILTFINI